MGPGDPAYTSPITAQIKQWCGNLGEWPLCSWPQFPHLSNRNSLTSLAAVTAGKRSSSGPKCGVGVAIVVSGPTEPTKASLPDPPMPTAVRPLEVQTPDLRGFGQVTQVACSLCACFPICKMGPAT